MGLPADHPAFLPTAVDVFDFTGRGGDQTPIGAPSMTSLISPELMIIAAWACACMIIAAVLIVVARRGRRG